MTTRMRTLGYSRKTCIFLNPIKQNSYNVTIPQLGGTWRYELLS